MESSHPSAENTAGPKDSPLQVTPLYSAHQELGAKFTAFAGWQMPVQYEKTLTEHRAVRSGAGLFDIAHMGLISLSSGNDQAEGAFQFLEGLLPRDLSKLKPGKAVYTQLLTHDAGIIDDIILYKTPENMEFDRLFGHYFLVCNAANAQTVLDWLKKQLQERKDTGNAAGLLQSVTISDLRDQFGLLALQGPKFADILARVGYQTDNMPSRFWVKPAVIEDMPLLVSRTGYTGEDGVELIVQRGQLLKLWQRLLTLGKPYNVKPIGLAARDTLRLEAAYPLHGNDIGLNDTPIEAGLTWSLHVNKSVPYVGEAVLKHQYQVGVEKKLYGFVINHKMIARQGDIIYKNSRPVGSVTSGSISPVLNLPIGLGYITLPIPLQPGDIVEIECRNKRVAAEIVEKPFYQKT
ncbi:MAG: glycine cleavage system aminomethyltransferase GcvT [Cyanobacteria bacterium P01_H01_bin.74]